MLTKIRTNIKKSFNQIVYLLVNADIFLNKNSAVGNGDNIWELGFEKLIVDLFNLDVKIVFYNFNNECLLLNQNKEFIKQNGHKIFNSNELMDQDCVKGAYAVIAWDMSDKDLVRSSIFSIAAISSEMDLKTISDYVSNFDGEELFVEIGNLIYRSKN